MFRLKPHIARWIRLVAVELTVACGLFAPFQPTDAWADANPANNVAAVTLTVGVRDGFPPRPVTDLEAFTNPVIEGQVLLQWTSPSEDNLPAPSVTAVSQYVVRIATYSGLSVGTATWWTNAQDLTGEPVPQVPGNAESVTFGNLEPGATFYFALRSVDDSSNISPFDSNTDAGTQVRVTVPDVPPNAPSGPTATAGDSAVTLSWNPVSATDLNFYRVYVGTTATPQTNPLQTVNVASTTTNTAITGLTNDTTHYFVITAVDKGLPSYRGIAYESAPSVVVSTLPGNVPAAPALSVHLASATTTQIYWILTDRSTNETGLRITSLNLGGGAGQVSPTYGPFASTGASVVFVETLAGPNVSALRYGESFTTSRSSFTVPVAAFTLANPPINTQVMSVSSTTAVVQWDANGNSVSTQYQIEFDDDSLFGSPSVSGWTLSNPATLAGLTPATTYYLRVYARNGDSVVTTPDVTVSTRTLVSSLVRPKAPYGLWAEFTELTPQGRLKIHWKPVTRKEDESNFTDPAAERYKIYRSQTMGLTDPGAVVTSTGTNAVEYHDVLDKQESYYYRVRAVDLTGNESRDWLLVEAKGDGTVLNLISLADDARSRFVMPAEKLGKGLVSGNNAWEDDIIIVGSQVASEEKGRVVKSIKFEAYRASTGEMIKDFHLKDADARLRVAYTVESGQVVTGAPGAKGAPVVEASKAKNNLALFWFNGVEWVKLGGNVDVSDTAVELRTSRLGRYQIRQAIRVGPASMTRVYPRVFSPNGDGWNDKVVFEFDNPGLATLKGEIFDNKGAKVSDLEPGPNPDASLIWDGKSNGQVVPGGIYIYQIEVGGESISGTVVVAQ